MHSLKTPSTGPKLLASVPLAGAALSARWVLRRAALWLFIVGLGVSGSCLLYMAASHAEADFNTIKTPDLPTAIP